MSLKILKERKRRLAQAEEELQVAKRRVTELQDEIKEMEAPSNMTDTEASDILSKFFKRAKAANEPGIDEDKMTIRYYSLRLYDFPESLRNQYGWAIGCFQSRDQAALKPDATVIRALNHFQIQWELDEGISEYRYCGM